MNEFQVQRLRFSQHRQLTCANVNSQKVRVPSLFDKKIISSLVNNQQIVAKMGWLWRRKNHDERKEFSVLTVFLYPLRFLKVYVMSSLGSQIVPIAGFRNFNKRDLTKGSEFENPKMIFSQRDLIFSSKIFFFSVASEIVCRWKDENVNS